MERLLLKELSWDLTFPHRVMPLSEEWFAGLLLRCDEVNHWESRTTLTHLLHPGPEKFHRCWRTTTPNLVVLQPSCLNLDYLAQHLALPINALLATTYHLELAHLYGPTRLHRQLLSDALPFHLCPQCIAEARLLRRNLTLPHITICPQHHIILIEQCHCGTSLHLFHRLAPPFTCHVCGRDWAELPQVEATPAGLAREQKFLRWYEFFFSKEAPPMTRDTLQSMTGSILKRSLGSLIASLVEWRRFPPDVLS